ncbi:hypothetical protein CVT25_006696, partial [Psilocybe cyanescens]
SAHLVHPQAHAPAHLNILPAPTNVTCFTFPLTKEFLKLTGQGNWAPWNNTMIMAINALGLYGHIVDPLMPGIIPDPLLEPTYPPPVHIQFTAQELSDFKDWWGHNGQVQHILISHLDTMVLASISQSIPSMGQHQSSRDMSTTSPQGLTLQDYIAMWHSSSAQLLATGYPLPPCQLLQLFVNGLPNNAMVFVPLWNEVFVWLNNSDDNSLPSLEDIMENVCIVADSAQWTNRPSPPHQRSQLPAMSATSTTTTTSSSTTPNAGTQCPTCTTCGGAHSTTTCFQPGGAMEGHRNEVLANCHTQIQANLAKIEEDLLEDNIPDPEENVTDLTVTQPIAALSLARPSSAESIEFSSYALSPLHIGLATLNWSL